MPQVASDVVVLVLRGLMLAALYLFLVAVMLTIRRDAARTAQPAAEASSARLLVINPGKTDLSAGESLPLRPITRLGRSRANTIVLEDTYVSSEHAVVAQRDGRWWLADQGSTNGTLLNDRPIGDEAQVQPGDVIRIGDIRLKLVV